MEKKKDFNQRIKDMHRNRKRDNLLLGKRKPVIDLPTHFGKEQDWKYSKTKRNSFHKKKHSDRYYELLEIRQKLPIWEAKNHFLKLIKKH